MEENEKEAFLHDWVVEEIQKRYSKEFNEIQTNTTEKKLHSIEGQYPDIIFGNYGQVVMIGEVETISNIKELKNHELHKSSQIPSFFKKESQISSVLKSF